MTKLYVFSEEHQIVAVQNKHGWGAQQCADERSALIWLAESLKEEIEPHKEQYPADTEKLRQLDEELRGGNPVPAANVNELISLAQEYYNDLFITPAFAEIFVLKPGAS